MLALKLSNISKYYASQTAVVMGLSNVSLEFSTGEFVAITGENGSGKSTLANVIGGMLPYEGGELFVMGQPTSHYNAADWERYRRDLIGFISQDYGILPGNTVFENVESALVLSGCDRLLAKEKTRDILKKVELSGFSRRRASKLSSGQKQRLAIARALAKPSKILIADEPTGNLDRENSDKVIRLLKEASEDRLVILITHEFSEAEDYITRHVVLSDGKVVQDTECGQDGPAREAAEAGKAPAKAAPGRKLAPYVARLTAKARPVFFVLTMLILILTCISSFVFVGNFIIATDDVPSRIYDDSAFINGDPVRLVVAKDSGRIFTPEEIEEIGKAKYVSAVEKYGYVSDVNYYYREGLDHRKFTSADFASDYDPINNPDAYTLSVKISFLSGDPKFIRSVSQAGALKSGRMPEGFYEVLSSDPDYRTGSRVEVYIRDRMHWGISQYVVLSLDVVGETDGSRGFYFSESFCRMLNNSVENAIINQSGTYISGGDLGRYPVAPYDYERYSEYLTPVFSEDDPSEPILPGGTLAENECVFPVDPAERLKYGSKIMMAVGNPYEPFYYDETGFPIGGFELVCSGSYKSEFPRLLLVSPETYEKMTGKLGSDQVSVFIDDYSYTKRVIDEYGNMGYLAVSPFTQGSTEKDPALEKERVNLLRISLAASVLTLVLQLILLKVTFSSLKDHYKLLSNMGLRAKTAYSSLAILFLFMTLIAELIAAAVILILNRYGYIRVVNIFKYLDPPTLLLIFAVHFVFCAIAYIIVARSIKKQVFTINGFYEDIDGELMEEVMSE